MGRVKLEANKTIQEREKAKEPIENVRVAWLLLIITIVAAFVPFMGSRMSRTAGDDKVYVAQAVEMEREGRWFVQTLADDPDYRKGAFHYIALRIGFFIFGDSMWATVYMNLILIVLASLALASLTGRHLGGDSSWAFWTGTAFALNGGIFSHAFASQMEVELACTFAIGMYLLDRAKKPDGSNDWWFWLCAGFAGMLKSPLHAVLLGITGILFWLVTGTLVSRLKSIYAWGALFAGVAFCLVSYLPPLIVDYDNFMATYLGRETFEKGSNGAPWHYPIIPLFTYSLIPWMFAAIVGYADGLQRFFNRIQEWRSAKRIKVALDSGHERLVILGWCLIIPSIVFFLYHPYRGQNYNLPVIGGVLVWLAALWSTSQGRWRTAYRVSMVLMAAVVLLVPILMTILVDRFRPMPVWWHTWTLPALWIGGVMTAKGFWDEAKRFEMLRPQALARKSIWFFWAVGFFLMVIGEREMVDIRRVYAEQKKSSPNIEFAYYNLHKNVWSEWAYLNFWAGVPVYGMHSEQSIRKAIADRDLLIVMDEMQLEKVQKILGTEFPHLRMRKDVWRRWKTKGRDRNNVPAWKNAWQDRDLSRIEKHYYILSFQKELEN